MLSLINSLGRVAADKVIVVVVVVVVRIHCPQGGWDTAWKPRLHRICSVSILRTMFHSLGGAAADKVKVIVVVVVVRLHCPQRGWDGAWNSGSCL